MSKALASSNVLVIYFCQVAFLAGLFGRAEQYKRPGRGTINMSLAADGVAICTTCAIFLQHHLSELYGASYNHFLSSYT